MDEIEPVLNLIVIVLGIPIYFISVTLFIKSVKVKSLTGVIISFMVSVPPTVMIAGFGSVWSIVGLVVVTMEYVLLKKWQLL